MSTDCAPSASFTITLYQSRDRRSDDSHSFSNGERRTVPAVHVSACSGFTLGLPRSVGNANEPPAAL